METWVGGGGREGGWGSADAALSGESYWSAWVGCFLISFTLSQPCECLFSEGLYDFL